MVATEKHALTNGNKALSQIRLSVTANDKREAKYGSIAEILRKSGIYCHLSRPQRIVLFLLLRHDLFTICKKKRLCEQNWSHQPLNCLRNSRSARHITNPKSIFASYVQKNKPESITCTSHSMRIMCQALNGKPDSRPVASHTHI